MLKSIRDVILEHGSCSVPGLGTFKVKVLDQSEYIIPKMGSIIIPTKKVIEFTMWVEVSTFSQNLFYHKLTHEEQEEARESIRQQNRLIKKFLGILNKPESVLRPYVSRRTSIEDSHDNDTDDNAHDEGTHDDTPID